MRERFEKEIGGSAHRERELLDVRECLCEEEKGIRVDVRSPNLQIVIGCARRREGLEERSREAEK
jgi:hypothetical protein